MKAKCYTETLSKYYTANVLEEKSTEYMKKLANLFSEFLVSDEELKLILKDCRETEFSGTGYMPLPDAAALIKIIKDVQVRTATKRMNEPEKPKQAFKESAGRMVCSDGEVIVRDEYFYRNMFLMGDLLGGQYPVSWIEEAFNLMDDEHKAQYKVSGDVKGKKEVMEEYFTKLELPIRTAKPYDECSMVRGGYGNWSRYNNN